MFIYTVNGVSHQAGFHGLTKAMIVEKALGSGTDPDDCSVECSYGTSRQVLLARSDSVQPQQGMAFTVSVLISKQGPSPWVPIGWATDVATVQDLLVKAGYLRPGSVSGWLDTLTKRAIEALQKRWSLPEDGVVNHSAMSMLRIEAANAVGHAFGSHSPGFKVASSSVPSSGPVARPPLNGGGVPTTVDEAWMIFGIKNKRGKKDVVKKMCRQLLAEWHPDRHVGKDEPAKAKAKQEFLRVNEAWKILERHCRW